MITRFAARALNLSGLRPLLGAAFRWSGVLCLNYHRIGDDSPSPFDREQWSAGAEAFDRQVAWLTTNFDVISPDDLLDVPLKVRDRFVLITFDDGYRDNYETAFPILARHRAPATFFVTTEFIGKPRLSSWDEIAWMVRSSPKVALPASTWLPHGIAYADPARDSAIDTLLGVYKTLPSDLTEPYLQWLAEATDSGRHSGRDTDRMWMTWDMLREMRAAGMVIGGHTMSHPVLANLGPADQWREISGCADRIAEELGEPMRYFSYPFGQRDSFDQHSRACLDRLGVRFAFSYYGGFQRFEEWDRLDVRRIGVERYMDLDWVTGLVTLPALFGAAR